MRLTTRSVFTILLWPALVVACTDRGTASGSTTHPSREHDASDVDGSRSELDTGPPLALSLLAVAPDHGPFLGGGRSVLLGSGFADGIRVLVDGIAVDVIDVRSVDRVEVTMPPHVPGPVDLAVELGDARSSLSDGYTYDALALEPPAGSVGGGTLVTLSAHSSATLASADGLRIGGVECSGLTRGAGGELGCTTGPHAPGLVDVEVLSNETTLYTLTDGFRYEPRPIEPGVGGGPISGAVHVSLRERSSSGFVAAQDVLVLVVDRDQPDVRVSGRTDRNGEVTLTAEALAGAVDVHVGSTCFYRSSLLGLGARDVVMEVFRATGLGHCAVADDVGGGSVAAAARAVDVRFLFAGGEFGTAGESWAALPTPAVGQERRALAFAIGERGRVTGLDERDALAAGVAESTEPVEGTAATARLGASSLFVDVVAFVGLTGAEWVPLAAFGPDEAFVPEGTTGFEVALAGLRRARLAPGTVSGPIDLVLDTPVDASVEARFRAPASMPAGSEMHATIEIELAHGRALHGVGPRVVGTLEGTATFERLPRIAGSFGASTRRVTTTFVEPRGSGSEGATTIRRVTTEPRTEATDFLGLPILVAPPADTPHDGTSAHVWAIPDGAADLIELVIRFDAPEVDDASRWRTVWHVIARGDIDRFVPPSDPSIPELAPLPPGAYEAVVVAASQEGFSFDEWRGEDVLAASARFDHVATRRFRREVSP